MYSPYEFIIFTLSLYKEKGTSSSNMHFLLNVVFVVEI